MSAPDITEIPLSKRKLALYLVGALGFVGLGVWFILRPEVFARNPILSHPLYLRVLGGSAILFFGIAGVFLFRKLLDATPGFVLTAEGFINNASGLTTGLVRWADVLDIQDIEVMGQELLLVALRNPEDYISQQTNPFKRNLLRTNFQSYGSPVHISANTLQCTYPELKGLLLAHLAASRGQA